MRHFLLCWVIIVPSPVAAQPPAEAAAIVAKAIRALGGEAKLGQVKAERVKIKGKLHEPEGFPFTGEIVAETPERFRYTIKAALGGAELTLIQGLNRDQGWTQTDGKVETANPAALADMRVDAHVDYLCHLTPLLHDKNLTLSVLDESKVRDRPAKRVKVVCKGKPDVVLSFDAESGLPIKSEYRSEDPESRKLVFHEEYLSDYREADPASADEARLRAAKIEPDGPALLEFLRQRTLTDKERDKIQAQIRALGHDSFQVREQAQKDLIARGETVRPALEQALKNSDLEVVNRAKVCLTHIGKNAEGILMPAIFRLVTLRRPAGAVEVLLAYLAAGPDEKTAREARSALAALAFRDGKPEPILVQALEDKDPHRRAAAAAVLQRDGKTPQDWPGQRVYLSGLKRAMKGVHYRDGKLSSEWEITDLQFFTRFDDSQFAKP